MVWTGFGAAAFVGDLGLHRTVDALPWLHAHPWLVSGAILAVAGGFQFTDLKDRCLDKCRHPGVYLMRHYGRGVDTAFRIGRGHGLFCLGCCWALMLMMFAAGVANLPWMAVLTGVMFYEKAGQRGRAVTPYVGMALLAEDLRLIDAEGLPAYLESSNPVNDRRYERLGFVRVGEFETPDGAHTLTTMWREGRAADS